MSKSIIALSARGHLLRVTEEQRRIGSDFPVHFCVLPVHMTAWLPYCKKEDPAFPPFCFPFVLCEW